MYLDHIGEPGHPSLNIHMFTLIPTLPPAVQFFNFVALPMYQSMAQAFPGCMPMLEAVQANFAHWTEKEKGPNSTPPSRKQQ